MSQAVPRPPRRSRPRQGRRRGQEPAPSVVTDLVEQRQLRQQRQRRQQHQERLQQERLQQELLQQQRPGKGARASDVHRNPVDSPRTRRPGTRHRSPRRRPLLPFVLGLALGYGLAGPLPRLVPSTTKLTTVVQPIGFGDRRVVVLGTDKVGENTDVMFTVRIRDGNTEVTQVPRDTLVESQQFGVVKANALYAFGGVKSVKQELSTLLNAPVDRYLRINLRAVERLAQAVGGVEVDVPKRMYYVDNSQGLYIDLQPGRQLLSGQALEGFLRFRHDEMGDLGRMERQRLVMAEVFRKLTEPSTLVRLPALLKVAGDDIKTDLNPLEIGQLITAMNQTQLKTNQLPGREFWYNDLSYWMPVNNRHFSGIEGQERPL